MEERIKLIGDSETRLDTQNCSGVINWKHYHNRCPERVDTNFITVRRATVLCLLATVDEGQISVHWFCNKWKIEWRSGAL